MYRLCEGSREEMVEKRMLLSCVDGTRIYSPFLHPSCLLIAMASRAYSCSSRQLANSEMMRFGRMLQSELYPFTVGLS